MNLLRKHKEKVCMPLLYYIRLKLFSIGKWSPSVHMVGFHVSLYLAFSLHSMQLLYSKVIDVYVTGFGFLLSV